MSKSTTTTPTIPTRQRIVSEAIRLFAARGYRGTTIAEIEEAAGLSPGSGGLYKHFASKQEVLAEAIQRSSDDADTMSSVLRLMPLSDLKSELTLLARGVLQAIGEQGNLIKILSKESDQFPELLAQFRDQLVQRGVHETADWLKRNPHSAPLDVLGVAAVGFGALVHFKMLELNFGQTPAELDEDRFVESWVSVMHRAIQGDDDEPAQS